MGLGEREEDILSRGDNLRNVHVIQIAQRWGDLFSIMQEFSGRAFFFKFSILLTLSSMFLSTQALPNTQLQASWNAASLIALQISAQKKYHLHVIFEDTGLSVFYPGFVFCPLFIYFF